MLDLKKITTDEHRGHRYGFRVETSISPDKIIYCQSVLVINNTIRVIIRKWSMKII